VDEKRLVRDFPARWMGHVMRGDTVLKDIFEGSSKQEDLVVKLLNTIFFFSSRMRFMSHNWSATKQRLHPQSVADIKPPYSFVRGQDSTM